MSAVAASALSRDTVREVQQTRRNRRRLQSFFKHYNPQQLSVVDETIQRYRGREESLFTELVRRYGPEPADDGGDHDDDSPSGPRLSPRSLGGSRRVSINPDAAMSAGAAATSAPSPSCRITAQSQADGTVGIHQSQVTAGSPLIHTTEEELRQLEWSQASLAALLTAYYATVDPRSAARAPREAAQYFGKEASLFSRLQFEYGSSPLSMIQLRLAAEKMRRKTETVEHAVPRNGGLTQVSQGGDRATREAIADLEGRLVAYYEEVNPDRITNASQLACMFGGSAVTEAQLFDRLEQQYGRRPAPRRLCIEDVDPTNKAASREGSAPVAPLQAPNAVDGATRKHDGAGSTAQSVDAAHVKRHRDATAQLPEVPRAAGIGEAANSCPSTDNATSNAPSTTRMVVERSPRQPPAENTNAVSQMSTTAVTGVNPAAELSLHSAPPPTVVCESGLAFVDEFVETALRSMDESLEHVTRAYKDHFAPEKIAIALRDVVGCEERQRRVLDVAEYEGFAAIKSAKRRLDDESAILGPALGLQFVDSTSSELFATRVESDPYSSFNSNRPGVRCYSTVLFDDI
jgi:hypothetical protein